MSRQILVRVDGQGDPNIGPGIPPSLPLVLEGMGTPPAAATAAAASSSAAVAFYRLLDPEAAVGQLKSKWSELVEPPIAAVSTTPAYDSGGDTGSSGSSNGGGTPWKRKIGVGGT